jgi:uncharacterized protein (TIRG00374 family)
MMQREADSTAVSEGVAGPGAVPAAGGRRRFFSFNRTAIIGLLIAGLLMWWALHDVAFADVLARVRGLSLLPFLGAVTLTTLGLLPLRVIRWRYMLRLQGEVLPFAPLFHATALGTMANYLLPARAGEFVRAYAARELTGARFSSALGSIALERVVDGLTIVAMMVLALAYGDFTANGGTPGIAESIALVAAIFFGGALLAAMWLVFWPKPFRSITDRLMAVFLPVSMANQLVDIRDGIIQGFDSLGSKERSLGVILWSIVLWSTNAAGIWLGLYAFGITVPWTFEAAGRASLAIYGVSASLALAFSAPFHLFAYFVPVTLFGLWSAYRTGLHISELRKQKPEPAVAH